MKRKAKKEKPPKDRVCFFYNELGHLKRNCKLYLEDLEKNKKDSGAIASSIYVIDNRLYTFSTWELWDRLATYSSRTPQWNGVSERRNRTLLDMVRSMMGQTDLPPSFWGHALETSCVHTKPCSVKGS
ncbi:hypothetical protein K1719_005207 [Acacia pycnantha]|nr:hypothetical protein K1719_005207 [Acacia pycnantha]